MKPLKNLLSISLVVYGIILPAAEPPAAEPPAEEDIFKALDYPELQVVPRASDRLRMESENEKKDWMTTNWTILVSSTATLFAAQSLKGSYRVNPPLSTEEQAFADDSTLIGTIVGASGIALALGLPYFNSYSSGFEKVKLVKGQDRKSQLLRERMSEEFLERQSSLMNVMRYASFAANFVASTRMQEKADSSKTKFAMISTALSLLPLVFTPNQVRVYRKHLEYKKKIYAPISSFDFHWDEGAQSWNPVYKLTWAL